MAIPRRSTGHLKISVGGVSPGPPRAYGVTVGMKF
jgi:hypothetical protein